MKARAEIRIMTKELVDQLLGMNTSNRNIKPTVIDAYKSDINAGKWMLTNQGIGISGDMVLVDGQHRLVALRDCGYPPVEMLIVWGISKEAQSCVDVHSKRSMRDIYALVYESKVGKIVPAICNVIYRQLHKWPQGVITAHQSFDVYDQYRGGIELLDGLEAISWFSAPVLAAAVVIIHDNPKVKDIGGRVLSALDRVSEGENLNKTMPEWHLRAFLESSKRTQNGMWGQRERYLKSIKAIVASISGQMMGCLRLDGASVK